MPTNYIINYRGTYNGRSTAMKQIARHAMPTETSCEFHVEQTDFENDSRTCFNEVFIAI